MATSKLQIEVGNLLDKSFPGYRVRENYRPSWLVSSNYTVLELDFFIEEINTAFEIQGDQHYKYVKHFHGTYENFEKQKMYDEEKKNLCAGRGVNLYEICTMMEAEIAVRVIAEKTGSKSVKAISPRLNNNKPIKEQIKKDIENRWEIVAKSKNLKALVEIDRWELKVCIIGKMCAWKEVHIPKDIADKIKSGDITFNQARDMLF